MTLLNSDPRCTGGDGNTEICPERDTCQRYTERMTGGAWVSTQNFHRPGDLIGCMDKIETKGEQ